MNPSLTRDGATGRLTRQHPGLSTLALFLVLAVVAGCEPLPDDVGLRITQVLESDYCAVEQPSAYVIESASQWHALRAGAGRFLPDPSQADAGADQYPALVDDEVLVVIAAGQQPSAGYRVVIDTYDWQRTQEELILQVTLESPPTGNMQAAVMTSPCSVVALRNYRGIEQVRFVGFQSELSVQLTVPLSP